MEERLSLKGEIDSLRQPLLKAEEELKLIKALLLLKNVEVHADLTHVRLTICVFVS
jgi:hypothetical protein